MERQLDAYCAHLRNERQVSPHTLEAYRRDLNKVLAYCEKQHVSSWKALDIQALRSLIARLHLQGQSSRSLSRLLSAGGGPSPFNNLRRRRPPGCGWLAG
ncbi:site-specific integrase, partial [Pseudomonas lactis]|uniref:site-specific integrase n=1 Tax=Pseudomonas lactis TaxID=1615674 RepID=UPI001F45848F